MLDTVFYNNTLQSWGISLLIIIGAIIINKLISLLNKYVVSKILTKTKNRFDDLLFQVLESPVLLGIMLLAIWVAISRLELPVKLNEIVSKAYEILTVLNVTWFFSRLSLTLLEEYSIKRDHEGKEQKKEDNRFFPLLKRFLLFVIWSVGAVTAMHNAGISVSALLGTLGIGGIAFALAAQDTVKNFLGGFTIFSDKIFTIGDRVRFDNVDGTVEDIGVRSTKIRTLDKRILTIPNYKIADALVENVASEPMRKVELKLGVKYDTTPDKMREAMAILSDMPNRVKYVSSKELTVAFTNFADSSLVLTFIYYIEKKGDIIKTNTNVNMEILTAFAAAAVEFAFPSQSVYLEK